MSKSEVAAPGPRLARLLSSVAGTESCDKDPKGGQTAVHVVKNLQPLPRRIVEAIREGNFVDFAWFPVLEEGPIEGDWKEGPGETEGGQGSSSGRRRKEVREVPDLSKWSTCFSLFQAAWAAHKPEMWLPLTAYREIIFKLARRHPWAQVVKYDRRFRQEAAGNVETRWDEERVPLVVDLLCSAAQEKGERKSYGGSTGTLPRKSEARRKGACFRFNRGNASCMYGAQCRFAHVCESCGGEHPAVQCPKAEGKKAA